jgi:hypothetical protein
MTRAIVPSHEPFRSEISDELDRIRDVRTARKFNEIQRELDETALTLKGTIDTELRLKLLREMRHLIEEADRLLRSRRS